jgi:threonine dehydratase
LAQFLERLGGEWNISLFHYRNQGSDRGQVLCGIQVPPETESRFEASLREVGYDYTEQTANPALARFLG